MSAPVATRYPATNAHRSRSIDSNRSRYDDRSLSKNPAFSWRPARSTQIESTGTSVLESRYDASIAKPTASDSGTNNWAPMPAMNNDGRNTDSTQSIASKRGTAVLREASMTPRARDKPDAKCVWMLSIETVASSTSTPTASARPPSVMMLIVWPDTHRQTTEASRANGIVATTIRALRRSRRNMRTISPVSTAPKRPSVISPLSAFTTYADWSNTRSILTSSGATLRMAGSAWRTFRITSSVDASARLVTGI